MRGRNQVHPETTAGDRVLLGGNDCLDDCRRRYRRRRCRQYLCLLKKGVDLTLLRRWSMAVRSAVVRTSARILFRLVILGITAADDLAGSSIDGVGDEYEMQRGEDLRPEEHERDRRGKHTFPVFLPCSASRLFPHSNHLRQCPPLSPDAQAGQAPETTKSCSRTEKHFGARRSVATGQSSRQKARSHFWQ